MHPMLNVAIIAARRAGHLINRAARDPTSIRREVKSHNDFVTEVDRAAEQLILTTLQEAYPKHSILAEESGLQKGAQSQYCWIIDPLDGTTNFIHGLPHYAISIGLQYKGQMEHGVVYDPSRNELFTATRGKGAFLDDKRIRVSGRQTMKEALIGTGFPFRDPAQLDGYMAMFRSVTANCAGIRRPGAAALDSAYVASGRYDGFWEIGLAPWDLAAGSLLVTEAGGVVTDLDGENRYLESGAIVAGNFKVLGQLLHLLSPSVTGATLPKSEMNSQLPMPVKIDKPTTESGKETIKPSVPPTRTRLTIKASASPLASPKPGFSDEKRTTSARPAMARPRSSIKPRQRGR